MCLAYQLIGIYYDIYMTIISSLRVPPADFRGPHTYSLGFKICKDIENKNKTVLERSERLNMEAKPSGISNPIGRPQI